MNLTPNFTLEEFTISDTATRAGIANTPPPEVAAHLYTLATGLEKVRAELRVPVKVLSGYRCEQLEKLLCQKDFAGWCKRHGKVMDAAGWAEYFARKAHPKGYAADFIAPRFGSPLQIVKRLQASNLKWDQLLMEGTWVHISFAPAMRQEVLAVTFTPGTGEPVYSQGV